MVKSDFYIIEHRPYVRSKVVFDRLVTPEEAIRLFSNWEFEDIIDEDTMNLGDPGDMEAEAICTDNDDE